MPPTLKPSVAAVIACDEPELPDASVDVTTYTPECVIDIPALAAANARASVKYRFVEPSVISSVLSFPATAVEIASAYAEVIAVSRVSVYALASTSAWSAYASVA